MFVCVCVFVDLSAFVCRLGKLNCSAFVNGTKQEERRLQGAGGRAEARSVFPGDALAARVIPDSTPWRESWVCECAPAENEF